MNPNLVSRIALALICMLGWQGIDANECAAKLLSPDKLKACQLHVVGIYSPKNQNEDDRVFVHVEPTDKPIVLVLTGYFGAQWNVTIEEGADVCQIIVPGYFEHSVVGVPDSIPTEFITYFPTGESSRRDYFWAYSWHSNNGRRLRSSLKEITGLEITTFQGEYAGSRFVVDGKRGLVKEGEPSTDPTRGTPENPKRSENPEPAANIALKDELAQRAHNAHIQRLVLSQKFGPNHHAVKQYDKLIETIQAELSRIGVEPIAPVTENQVEQSQRSPLTETDPREIIESLVRESFQLETRLRMARVQQAEADLARIKAQLKQRQAFAERIINDRVDQLLKQQPSSNGKTDVDASAIVLAQEGWEQWRKQNWRAALPSFQSALKLDPDNESAQNGLGWTYVHLQEFDKAIAEFKKLLQSDPTHGGALNGLGQCLLVQGKLDEAERELLKATEDVIAERGEAETVRLGMTASWQGLVRTYLQKQDYTRAKKWIDRYLKYKPDDPMMIQMRDQVEARLEPSN